MTPEEFDEGNPSKFDLILMVHVLYYVDYFPHTIQKYHPRLIDGGKLVILQAPFEIMNQLSSLFWSSQVSHKLPFSEEVSNFLDKCGFDFSKQRIDAVLNLSNKDDSGNKATTEDVLAFLLQIDYQRLVPDVTCALHQSSAKLAKINVFPTRLTPSLSRVRRRRLSGGLDTNTFSQEEKKKDRSIQSR